MSEPLRAVPDSSELARPDAATRRASTARPRLLFLCQTLPFPPDGGVSIRSFHILRLLAASFDVTALCFYRQGIRPTQTDVQASIEGLRPFAEVEAFAIPQERSRLRLVLDHLRSVLRGRVYTRYAYQSNLFERRLRELLATRTFDLVHLDSLDLSGYLPLLEGLPVACTHHNIESALLKRRAEYERSPWLRPYLRFQAWLTRKDEQFWCGRVQLNITVSPDDQARLERMVPGARVMTLPNGVDTARFRPAKDRGHGLVFVGGHSWFPNRDAMSYYTTDILPRLRASGERVGTTWVGRAPDWVQAHYAQTDDIRLTGYVDDVRPYVQSAACYVVPLRVGGGTRLKILDAWAMGKAVVSTSIGCEGLQAIDGQNILIRDTPDDFAEAVITVLRDDRLREQLGQAGRETAVTRYEWEVIGRSLAHAYFDLIPGQAKASTP